MAAKPRFDGEWVKLNQLCTKGRSALRQKDLTNDGPYAVYGASGIVGSMPTFQNDIRYVAVVKDGAGVGRASLCSANTSVLGTMQALIPVEEVSPEYLLHLIRAMRLGDGFSGSTIPHIYFKDYGQRLVRRVSMVDQGHIVDTLGSIERQMDIARGQLTKLDDFVKSRFAEMFGDFKTNPYSWDVYSFNQFASIDTHMTKDYASFADAPHVGIDSIESCTGELIGYRTVREDNVRSGKYVFGPDHIIYSKIRPALNKVALPDFEGVCSADAYPILPNKRLCNRVFLAYVMRSDYFLEYILPLSGRAQMPKVNKKALMGFSMPLPPLTLQQEFADFAAEVDKSRFIVQQQIEKLQMLYDSLAQEYFS